MAEITIPPAALEAAARAIAQTTEPKDKWRYHIPEARATALALLEAWPGMVHYRGGWEPVVHNNRKPHFILPLPQEVSDDK